MMIFNTNLIGPSFRPFCLLIFFSLLLISCASDPHDDVSGRQENGSLSNESIDRAGEQTAAESVEHGVERLIESGERYASILQEIHTVDDVEEYSQELVKVFATMKELEIEYRDHQQLITARLDSNGRSVALNERLRNELMRIAADSAMATRLAELRTSVTGLPIQ
jgi:hypothetical protein